MECIICGNKSADVKQFVKNPTKAGLLTLFTYAEKRRDEVAKRILPQKSEILARRIQINYHVECRKVYTSAQNTNTSEINNNMSRPLNEDCGIAHPFDIRTMCLICNERGVKQRKKLISVQAGDRSSIFKKIMDAASERQDADMLSKLAGLDNLYGCDGKYHKACYAQYIAKRNIHYARKKKDSLSTVMADESNSCHSSNYDPEPFDTSQREEPPFENEMHILHTAAGILKKHMRDKTNLEGFPKPSDINLNSFSNQVPEVLLQFVSWLIDDVSYSEASTVVSQKAIIPTNIIMGLYNPVNRKNYFHMAFGLHIYHAVKSKSIIETLWRMGLCCSYNDVRTMMTGLATSQLNKNLDLYVPSTLVKVDVAEKNYIHGSMDNFDLNEDTIDGKGTTHAMAMVLFQKESVTEVPANFLPKSGKRALTEEDWETAHGQIVHYNKATARPEPMFLHNGLEIWKDNANDNKLSNLAYAILRCWKQEYPFLGWTDFNNLLSKNQIYVSKTVYLPFLNAPPTDFDTIFTAMCRLVEIARHFNQNHIVVTADLSIYSKAREILWSRPKQLDGRITLQLGGMHLAQAYIASIGHIFGDAGLRSLLVECDVYADQSCRMMLEGKQYARAIRGLTLAYEALSRSLIKAFLEVATEPEMTNIIEELKEMAQSVALNFHSSHEERSEVDHQAFERLLQLMSTFQHYLDDYITHGCQSSKTFKFWIDFLQAVDLLLRMLHAEKDGQFKAYLHAVAECLPLLSAAGRHLYTRWIPVYLSDMKDLQDNFPDMFDFLEQGGFVVKKTSEKRFNCVASDMALEQTINKDCKSSSGVVGFSRSPGALLRWLITRHIVGEYSENFKKCTTDFRERLRKEGKARNHRNEDDICKIMHSLNTIWCNPFDCNTVPSQLVNICTGKIVSDEVESSLGNFMEDYTEKISISMQSLNSESFWKPVKRSKALTFEHKSAKSKRNTKASYIGSEQMFRRILCAARLEELDLDQILSYELTHFPSSLFNDDGTMRKTVKSELCKKIETSSNATCLELTAEAVIFDGMVSIQELNENSFSTFQDLAQTFFMRILRSARQLGAKRINIVFDAYISSSIKSLERKRRGDSAVATFDVTGPRKVPKFRDFLLSSNNKRSLLLFVTNFITTNAAELLQIDETLIIAGGFRDQGDAVMITKSGGSKKIEDLKCNHEEADTRIVLHLLMESLHSSSIMIKSIDTDVLVLLVYYCSTMTDLRRCRVTLQLGRGKSKRTVVINKIIEHLGLSVCTCLPAIHCLTGCDTTSAFYKIGKRTALDVLLKNTDKLKNLSTLHTLSKDEAISLCTVYALLLYRNKNTGIDNLNSLRRLLSSQSRRSACELPPTTDAFSNHVLRCMYQLKTWLSSHLLEIPQEDPGQYGWRVENDIWDPVYTLNDPVPEHLRRILDIVCSDNTCDNRRCACFKEGLRCCSMCRCKGCKNVADPDTDGENDLEIEI